MNTNFKELAEYFDSGDFSDEALAAQPVTKPVDTPSAAEPMDSFTIRLPVSVLEAVRAIAKEENDTTGSVIRRMVEHAVAEHTSDEATVSVGALRELISLAQNADQQPEKKSRRETTRSTVTRRVASKAKVSRVGKTTKQRKVS